MADAEELDRVGVVVVTFNGAPWIRQCLQAVTVAAPNAFIIVVDNASTDSTVSVCRDIPGLEIVENNENLGFGRGCNIGMSRALARGADWVLLINQDTVVHSEMLTWLLDAARGRPKTGIVCPVQWNGDYSALDDIFLRYYAARFAPAMLSDAMRGQQQQSYTVARMPAAAWLLSRRCLSRVGGFDPLFFMYNEDDDFCARVALHGYSIQLVPAARFAHLRGFHGNSDEPAAQRFHRLVRRMRSDFVSEAKQLEGQFGKNAWRAALGLPLSGLRELTLYADPIYFLATLVAVVLEVKNLPAVWRHRRACLRGGSLWLGPGADMPISQGTRLSENDGSFRTGSL